MATNTEIALLKQEMKMVTEQNREDHQQIKADVCSVKKDVKELKDYLIQAVEQKADKAEVDKINSRLSWAASAVILAFLGLLVYLVESHIIK